MAAIVDTLNSVEAASVSTVNSVPSASIASINGITWDAVESFYNGVIDYSAMFDFGSTTTLTQAGLAGDTTEFTISLWFKQTSIATANVFLTGGADNENFSLLYLDGSNYIRWRQLEATVVTQDLLSSVPEAIFRDFSGWYHLVASYDSSEVASIDRMWIYINGIQITLNENTPIPLNDTTWWGGGALQTIGSTPWATSGLDGYMADVINIDGMSIQAGDFAITDFGESKQGVWIPKAYTGAYGDDGWHLDFSDNTHFGDDKSGNTNDFTDNNMGTDHQVTDTPENNYCTLDDNNTNRNLTSLSEGGLSPRHTPSGDVTSCGTFLMQTGKWYWEVDIGADTFKLQSGVVAADTDSGDLLISGRYVGQVGGAALDLRSAAGDIEKYQAGASTTTDLGAAEANDIVQVAYDADANKIWFGKNNVWADSGDPSAGTDEAYTMPDSKLWAHVPAVSVYAHSTSLVNFGQRAFAYTPPTGFLAPCSANMTAPTVVEPAAEGFSTILYEGTGAEHEITGVGFSPDFVWIKKRSDSGAHNVFDTVRGATERIRIDDDAAEDTQAQQLKSFDGDGFTLGTADGCNKNNEDYVAYCIKEGAAYGFDIVSYSGTSIAHAVNHDLGVAPELMIIKGRTQSQLRDWHVYHNAALNKTSPETDYGQICETDVWADTALPWNDTAPTSTQFTVGTSDGVNDDTYTYIAYLFASIPGFSKVFSYVGNGNANGPYVYLGFRPRYFLIRNITSIRSWQIIDSERDPFNDDAANLTLYADINNAESGNGTFDILANGFKLRSSTSAVNGNNTTHVGIAFADQPFKYSNAR